MNDLPIHLLLFAITATVVVVISAMFSEADDKKALASLPRRLLVFFVGCGLVAAVMLICEHTFASLR